MGFDRMSVWLYDNKGMFVEALESGIRVNGLKIIKSGMSDIWVKYFRQDEPVFTGCSSKIRRMEEKSAADYCDIAEIRRIPTDINSLSDKGFNLPNLSSDSFTRR